MDRRHLVSGGLAAAVAGALGTPAPASAQQREGDERVAGAIADLQRTFERSREVSPELTRIREQQRVFLRANHKFPDYMEIGIAVWEAVYDWHVRHARPVAVARTPDGRYAMTITETTTLILRPEQADTYVGFGFDAR